MELHQQPDEGRLAAPRRPDQSHLLSWLNPDTDILENIAAIAIGEADILEIDRGGPAPPAGRPTARAQSRFSRLTQQLLQLLDECSALPDIPEPIAEELHGPDNLQHPGIDQDKVAGGHRALLHTAHSHPERGTEPGDKHQRCQHAVCKPRVVVSPPLSLRLCQRVIEERCKPRLAGERLDGLDVHEPVRQPGTGLYAGRRHRPARPEDTPGAVGKYQAVSGGAQGEHADKGGVEELQHQGYNQRDLGETRQEREQGVLQDEPETLQAVLECLDHLSRRAVQVLFHRQREHMREGAPAEAAQDRLFGRAEQRAPGLPGQASCEHRAGIGRKPEGSRRAVRGARAGEPLR